MEEVALTVSAVLVRSILPVGLIAVSAGLITLGAGIRLSRKTASSRTFAPDDLTLRLRSTFVERIAVGLCASFSIIGLVVAFQTVRSSNGSLNGYQALSALFVLATILMGLPALLWKTRFRLAAEGVATIALAVASALAGFSIGFTFVPLLVLMIWICVQHLREVDNSPTSPHASSG